MPSRLSGFNGLGLRRKKATKVPFFDDLVLVLVVVGGGSGGTTCECVSAAGVCVSLAQLRHPPEP